MKNKKINREKKRQRLLEELNSYKSDVLRNKWGQFATPSELSTQIVRTAMRFLPKKSPIRFAEPGFGTGAFFSALASSTTRLESATGIELDKLFVSAMSKLWGDTCLRIVEGDFTKIKPPEQENEKFNLLISNPPYIRHHHLSVEEKSRLRDRVSEIFGIRMSGLSGLYVYFLVLSKAWMAQGGVGAWLIPSEFMDVNYGRQLKQFLLDEVRTLRIHRFRPEDVRFDDALVTSTVVLFQNSPNDQDRSIEFSSGPDIEAPSASFMLSAEQISPTDKWSTYFKKATTRRNSNNKGCVKLKDLFEIKRGIATGNNGFFIIPESKVKELQLPMKFLRPILPSPRYLDCNRITARRNGLPKLEKQLFVLDCQLPIAEIKNAFPTLASYLKLGCDKEVDHGYLCRSRSPWYSQEHRVPPKILCTYMGRSHKDGSPPFRFIFNESDAIATNVYLLIYPKPWLKQTIEGKQEKWEKIFHAFQSIDTNEIVSEGRVYGGGLHKVEPKELLNVSAELVLEQIGVKLPEQKTLFA